MYIPVDLLNIIYDFKSQLEHTEKMKKCLKVMSDRHLWVECDATNLHFWVNDSSMGVLKSKHLQALQSDLYPGMRAHRMRITNKDGESFQRVVFEGFYKTIMMPGKKYQYFNILDPYILGFWLD